MGRKEVMRFCQSSCFAARRGAIAEVGRSGKRRMLNRSNRGGMGTSGAAHRAESGVARYTICVRKRAQSRAAAHGASCEIEKRCSAEGSYSRVLNGSENGDSLRCTRWPGTDAGGETRRMRPEERRNGAPRRGFPANEVFCRWSYHRHRVVASAYTIGGSSAERTQAGIAAAPTLTAGRNFQQGNARVQW